RGTTASPLHGRTSPSTTTARCGSTGTRTRSKGPWSSRDRGLSDREVAGPERRGERSMGGSGADQDRTRRVHAVPAGERERQTGERWPAPAARGTGGVRAERALHRAADLGGEAG